MADDWFAQQVAQGGYSEPLPQGGYLVQTQQQHQLPDGTWVSPNEWAQRSGLQAPGAGAPAPDAAAGNPTDRAYVQSQLANWYASQGLTPTGPGTGPTDIAYYTDKILETGGWTNQTGKGEDNINYWTSRIPQDLAEAGRGGGGAGAAGGGFGGAGGAGFGGMGGPRPYGTSAAPEAGAFHYDPFQAPDLNETTDPGYGARLQTGLDAIQRSAAAKGTLLTGGTLKGLNKFAQDYASNEYGNVYNRALGAYNTNYNTAFQPWQSNFNNAMQSWQGNLGAQNQGYNQLFSLANMGYGAAGQQGALGTAYAGQAGNLLGSQATNTGSLITGAGNAASAGTIGQANAFNQGLAGASNAAQTYYLSRLLNPSTPSTPTGATPPYFAY